MATKSADGYDLNAQSPDGTHKEDWLDIGFKAQEVEALEIAAGYNKDNKTNLVSSHTGDGKQMGLQYSKFVPILVKAIQEQQALIESLTARIRNLRRINKMEERTAEQLAQDYSAMGDSCSSYQRYYRRRLYGRR